MKLKKYVLAISLILIVAIDVAAYAEEKHAVEPSPVADEISVEEPSEKPPSWKDEIGLGVNFDFASRHVWRGAYWTGGMTWMPSAWISAYGFTNAVWGRMPVANVAYQGKFNCVVDIISYEHWFGNFGIKPGFIAYTYPNVPNWGTTGETSLGLYYSLGPITFFTDQYIDVVDFRGAYYGDFGIGYAHEIGEKFLFEGAVTTAWANSRFNRQYSGYNRNASRFLGFDIGLKGKVLNFLNVKPYLHYSVVTDTGLRRAQGDPNIFSVGVNIGITK